MRPSPEVLGYARTAFGWDGDLEVSAGPRGALGQIWRISMGAARFALKEIFDEPPTEASIRQELEFVRRANAGGVLVPASHADRRGRYLVTLPGGTWLRCYDWVDLHPVPITAPDTPRELGALLARMHRCAPATSVELDGEPPYDWYDSVPASDDWADVAERSVSESSSWRMQLNAALEVVPQLGAAVHPANPAQLLLCHRDLHPENVFVDANGALVVVDFDDMGPAEPGRELVCAAFDWFCNQTTTDLEAVAIMVKSYIAEGGPGRVTEPADLSMLIASRLNFLLEQLQLALDPKTERRHRDWAYREIEVHLNILPSPRQLRDVLAVMRRVGR